MHTILYFGSFNPIHRGHVAIARYVLARGLGEELWFVVSPHNPLKDPDSLVSEQQRLELVSVAIREEGLPGMKACDVEFAMPRPSFTMDTLRKLQVEYPKRRFSILLGADNLEHITEWKEYRDLLKSVELLVYPRPGYICPASKEASQDPKAGGFLGVSGAQISWLGEAPQFEVDASTLRARMAAGEDVSSQLPRGVYDYINLKKLYGCQANY